MTETCGSLCGTDNKEARRQRKAARATSAAAAAGHRAKHVRGTQRQLLRCLLGRAARV